MAKLSALTCAITGHCHVWKGPEVCSKTQKTERYKDELLRKFGKQWLHEMEMKLVCVYAEQEETDCKRTAVLPLHWW